MRVSFCLATVLMVLATGGCLRFGFDGVSSDAAPDQSLLDLAGDATPSDAPATDAGLSTVMLRFEGGSDIRIRDIAVVDRDDYVIVGHFTGSITLDTMHPGRGANDIFVARVRGDGSFAWAHTFGSAADDQALQLLRYPQESLFVSGYLGGDIDFGTGLVTVMPPGPQAFLLKLNIDTGATEWVLADSRGLFSHGTAVARWKPSPAAADAVLWTGAYALEMTLAGNTLAHTTFTDDCFLAVIDLSGQVTKLIGSSASGTATCSRIVQINDTPWMVGTYAGEATFGTSQISTASGAIDLFLARVIETPFSFPPKLSAASTGTISVANATSGGGRVFISGGFDAQVQFDVLQTNSGDADGYVAAADLLVGTNDWVWSQQLSGTNLQFVPGIALMPTGEIAIAGSFREEVALGPLPLSSGDDDAYFGYLTKAGMPLGLITTGQLGNVDTASNILSDSGMVVVTGTTLGSDKLFDFTFPAGNYGFLARFQR